MLLLTLLNSLGFIIPAIVCIICKRNVKLYSIVSILYLLTKYINVYFNLPSRNLLSILASNTIGLIIFIILFVLLNHDDIEYKVQQPDLTMSILKALISVFVVLVVIVGVGELHSALSVKSTYLSIKSTNKVANQAPTFKKNETPVALAPATVLNRTRKSISDLPNSQYYNVSDQVQAQYYQGRPVYIVPISYDGFWAMQKAHHQIPGYFMIDATRQNATPKFIKKPYSYAVSAYFGHDTSRQLYRHNPEWLKLGDGKAQLEIDNQGNPYWVQTVYKSEFLSHRINYNKLHVTAMNAKTGQVTTYSLNHLPSWIDEGITSDVASQMNHDYGYYSRGFWNKYFGKTGIKKPTKNGPEDGVTSVFDTKGQIHYFTDFTNPNSSDSALGYSMINARTGKLDYYHASGLMDSDGATDNANQNYKAQKWEATMPIIYNVNGKPTWVMTIIDNTDAIRGYYYLDAQDQSIYGSGTSVNDALDAFRQAIVNNGGSAGNTPGVKTKNIIGTVDRLAVLTNNNKVMFTLHGSNTIYTINTDDYSTANLLKTGDNIKFSAKVVKGQSIGNVSKFVNESMK